MTTTSGRTEGATSRAVFRKSNTPPLPPLFLISTSTLRSGFTRSKSWILVEKKAPTSSPARGETCSTVQKVKIREPSSPEMVAVNVGVATIGVGVRLGSWGGDASSEPSEPDSIADRLWQPKPIIKKILKINMIIICKPQAGFDNVFKPQLYYTKGCGIIS